jgi:putative nucleotidyltransferase with HDIG domain
MLTKQQVILILKELRISIYNNNINNHNKTTEVAIINTHRFTRHCIMVGRIAEKIAEKLGLDAMKAYIMGCLHDIGRYQHMNGFHGLTGYEYLIKIGQCNIAQPSLTHTFLSVSGFEYNFFDVVRKNRDTDLKIIEEQEIRVKHFLENITPNDYDYIVALADTLAIGTSLKPDTLQTRLQDIYDRYYKNQNTDINLFKQLSKMKTGIENYMSKRLNCSVDDILNEITEEQDKDYMDLFFDESYKKDLGKDFENSYTEKFKKTVDDIISS